MKIYYAGPPPKDSKAVIAWIDGLIAGGQVRAGEFRLKWRISEAGEQLPYLEVSEKRQTGSVKRPTNPG